MTIARFRAIAAPRSLVIVAGLGISLSGAASSSHGAIIDSLWKNGTDGNWKDAVNWTNGVPSDSDATNGYHVDIDKAPANGAAAYTVTLDSNKNLGNGRFEGDVADMFISHAAATLLITSNAKLRYNSGLGILVDKGTLKLQNGTVEKVGNNNNPVLVKDRVEVIENGTFACGVAVGNGGKFTVSGTAGKPAGATVNGNLFSNGAVLLQATAGNNQVSGASLKTSQLSIGTTGSFTTKTTLAGNGKASIILDGPLLNENSVEINARTQFKDSTGNGVLWENKGTFNIDVPVNDANFDKLVLDGGNVADNKRPVFKQTSGKLVHKDQFYASNIVFDFAGGTVHKSANFPDPGTIQLVNSRARITLGTKPFNVLVPSGPLNITFSGDNNQLLSYIDFNNPADLYKPGLNKDQSIYLQPGGAAKAKLTLESHIENRGKITLNANGKPLELVLSNQGMSNMRSGIGVEGEHGVMQFRGDKEATVSGGLLLNFPKSKISVENRVTFKVPANATMWNAGTISLDKAAARFIIDAPESSKFANASAAGKGLITGNGVLVCPDSRWDKDNAGTLKVKRIQSPDMARSAGARTSLDRPVLTWDGGYSMGVEGELQVDLDVLSSTLMDFGILNSINGPTELLGSLVVFMNALTMPEEGQVLTIVTADSPVTGGFTSGLSPDGYLYPVMQDGSEPAVRFAVTFNDPLGEGSPYNVTLTTLAVPAPGAVSVAGMLALLAARRRRG